MNKSQRFLNCRLQSESRSDHEEGCVGALDLEQLNGTK